MRWMFGFGWGSRLSKATELSVPAKLAQERCNGL
jgi:hypothetical protein